MIIKSVEAIPLRIPLKNPLKWATGHISAIENVIVKIVGEDGTYGVAEGVARPGIYGETQESVYYAIKNHLAPLLIGEDSFNIERIWEKMDVLVWNLAAKGAIDIALYDLNGKILNTPIYNLLGGAYREEIPVSWTSFGTFFALEDMVADAKKRYDQGFRAVKVKAGVHPDKDIEVCKLIHEACGSDMKINLDPNMVYSREEALRVGKELDGILDSFEEPLPSWDDEGRLELSRRINAPLLSDESTFTIPAIHHQLKLGAIGRIGVKLPRTGFTLSRKVIAMAETANIPVQISTQVECDLGSAACAQLGAAFKQISLPCEIGVYTDDNLDYADSMQLLKKSPEIKNGSMIVPNGPGLGVEVDWEKIEEYRIVL